MIHGTHIQAETPDTQTMMTKICCVKAVLFDFDGTLSRPGALDFNRIKKELGCPLHLPVLEFIHGLVDDEERERAMNVLDAFERSGAERSEPNLDAEETVRILRSRGMGLGLITRNCRASIERAMDNFPILTLPDFDILITREDPLKPKPSPDGIRHAADRLGVKVSDLAVVGDFIFDMQAGRSAGAVTVFLTNHHEGEPVEADITIHRLRELPGILR